MPQKGAGGLVEIEETKREGGRRGMCEAHAFLLTEGREQMLLENVDALEVEGDEVRMVNIFGEQKILKAKVRAYVSKERKILLEAMR